MKRAEEGRNCILFDCKFDPDTQRLHKVKQFRPQNTWNILITSVILTAGNRRKTNDTKVSKSTNNKRESLTLGQEGSWGSKPLHLADKQTDPGSWRGRFMANCIKVLGHCSFYQPYGFILNTGVVRWQHVSLSNY